MHLLNGFSVLIINLSELHAHYEKKIYWFYISDFGIDYDIMP